MLRQNEFLLTLAIETEELSLTQKFINSFKERMSDWEGLEILVLFHMEECSQEEIEYAIEGARLLCGTSKVSLRNQAARYAQGRFMSFLKAEQEFHFESLKKALEILNNWAPDVLRLIPLSQNSNPGADTTGSGHGGNPVSKVNLCVRYAAQPYSLHGLFFKTELLKARPFSETLGEYAAGPWLIVTFRESSDYYMLEDPCFVQSSGTKPALPPIQADEFFDEYVWKPYYHYKNKDGEVPLYVQVSLLRNIGRFLLEPEDSIFEKDVFSFLSLVSEKAVHKAPGIQTFHRRFLLYQRSRLLGEKCPDKLLELGTLPINLDLLEIKEDCLTIEGFAVCMSFQEVTDFYAETDGQRYHPVRVNRDKFNQNLFKKPLRTAYGFCFKIPLTQTKGKISFL